MRLPFELIEALCINSDLETCVALSQTNQQLRRVYHDSERLVRSKVCGRVPWMRPGEPGTDLTNWFQCAQVVVARNKNKHFTKIPNNMLQTDGVNPQEVPNFQPPVIVLREAPTNLKLPEDFEAAFDMEVKEGMRVQGYTMNFEKQGVSLDMTSLKTVPMSTPPASQEQPPPVISGETGNYFKFKGAKFPIGDNILGVEFMHENEVEVLFVICAQDGVRSFIIVPKNDDGSIDASRRFAFHLVYQHDVNQSATATFITCFTGIQSVFYVDHANKRLIMVLMTPNPISDGDDGTQDFWEKFGVYNGLVWHLEGNSVAPYHFDMDRIQCQMVPESNKEGIYTPPVFVSDVSRRNDKRIVCVDMPCLARAGLLQGKGNFQRYLCFQEHPEIVFDLATGDCLQGQVDSHGTNAIVFAGTSKGKFGFWKWGSHYEKLMSQMAREKRKSKDPSNWKIRNFDTAVLR